MTFMNNLMSNPGGSISGQPQQGVQDPLGLVNNLKDREMRDFQNKATFMADLSLKQDRLRALFDPSKNQTGTGEAPQQSSGITPGSQPKTIDPAQQAELGIRQQQANTESQRVNQQGKFGQEAQDVKSKQEALNQQKSDQIHQQKQSELEAKISQANDKLTQAQAALAQKGATAEASLQAHKDLAAAVEERHKLEIDNMNHKFEVTSGQHQQTIDNLTEQLKQRGHQSQDIKTNPDGTEKSIDTRRGSAADIIQVQHKNGKTYEIPKDKLDEWNANHAPEDQQPAEPDR